MKCGVVPFNNMVAQPIWPNFYGSWLGILIGFDCNVYPVVYLFQSWKFDDPRAIGGWRWWQWRRITRTARSHHWQAATGNVGSIWILLEINLAEIMLVSHLSSSINHLWVSLASLFKGSCVQQKWKSIATCILWNESNVQFYCSCHSDWLF